MTRYVVIGFPHNGCHSLVQHLINQGHEARHMAMVHLRSREQLVQFMEQTGEKFILITKKHSRYSTGTIKDTLEKIEGLDIEHVTLEDLKSKYPDFPHLNKTEVIIFD